MSEAGRHEADETQLGSDREWLIPSAIMTVLLGIAAVALMPAAGYSQVPPYFSRFVTWMAWALLAALGLLPLYVVKLWASGLAEPTKYLKAKFLGARTRTLIAIAGVALAGIDMLFFMWIKPEVTAVAPFWADELFADMDKAIFGRDPWLYFKGLDLTFHAWAYSFFWAVAISATLVWLFAQRPSRERSATILNYFALWSIFGPIGQYLGSAAGPIFYQKIGLGDRFAELSMNIPYVTNAVSNYLWDLHTSHTPAVGAGISAMPSLHIATVVWIYLAFRVHRSRISPLAAIFAVYIFALSVALGWHYAVDGIAGMIGAFAFQWLADRYLGHRRRWSAATRPALATSV